MVIFIYGTLRYVKDEKMIKSYFSCCVGQTWGTDFLC